MKTWKYWFSAGAMGAFFVLVMGIWALVSAIEYQWFTRADVTSWYSWTAAAVPQSLQESGAAQTCSISLGGVCTPVDAPAQHAGLSCWASKGAIWCADPTFAAATMVWSLLSLVGLVVSRLLWPTLGALPPEAGPRARRNHAWFQLGLEAVMIVWMTWTVFDIVQHPAGASGSDVCTGTGAACVYDVADRLAEAAFYVVMVLVGVVSMIDTGVRNRREILYRAEPVSESAQ